MVCHITLNSCFYYTNENDNIQTTTFIFSKISMPHSIKNTHPYLDIPNHPMALEYYHFLIEGNLK